MAYISVTRKNAASSRLPYRKTRFTDTALKSATMDEDESHYNDGNRAFLQALMARGTITFKEGQQVLAAIFTVQERQSSIHLPRFQAYLHILQRKKRPPTKLQRMISTPTSLRLPTSSPPSTTKSEVRSTNSRKREYMP